MSIQKTVIPVFLGVVLGLSSGCSTKSAAEAEVTRVTGRIVDLEFVDSSEIKKQTRKSNTRISASVSSGGGVSIGIGVLLPLLSGKDDNEVLVRYTVRLAEDEELVIYHPDQSFIIGDCIDIIETEGSKEPPQLQLSIDPCPGN